MDQASTGGWAAARFLLEFVTWSAGTDSGTVCKVLRILADIVGQPVLLPQTLQRFDDAPSPLTPEV